MRKKSKVKNISEKVMVATLTSSIIMTPGFVANAETYDTSTISNSINEISKETEAVSILDSKGWLESASIEWKGISGATGYDVYYKESDQSDLEYKQIDSDLIREYSSYYRADVLGLTSGNYTMKIVPIIDKNEYDLGKAITKSIKVKENVREGFAFSSESSMGTSSGGYDDDGAVAKNAQILYVTADNINTVNADVITNNKGAKTTCTGLTDILAKRQKGYDKTPLIIRMIGQINSSDINGLNSNGYLELKGCYNITFEGVGEDATAYKWGFLIRDAHNVELRNIGIMLFPDDAISLDTGNENIWVHNNDIFYGTAGSDKDQAKGDGSCDVKGKSTYVTVSYNHFYDSGKCSLCGMKDSENFYVTYHHNWFDHSDSRHPRIRVGSVHVYNNYFDGNSKYGVGVTKGSSAFIENNYFRNCKYPMLISEQGTDIANGNTGTFSNEDGGMIKAYNNKVEGASSLIYANDDKTQFDAYLASSRDEKVPETYKSVQGNNAYNNFDTSSAMYEYSVDSTEDVENVVTSYAGRVDGGDFIWKFTDADDTDSSMNNELMDKIKNYKSDLVSVGGNSIVSSSKIMSTESVEEISSDSEDIDKSNIKENEEVSTTTESEKGILSEEATNLENNESETSETIENKSESEVETVESAKSKDSAIGNLEATGINTNLADKDDDEFTDAVYVSPNGSSNNDGSYNNPLDLISALDKVKNSEASVILLESGTYKFDSQITISNNGSKDAYNVLKGCKDAKVVLDFSNEEYNSKDTSKNARGIQLNGNYWYVGNITIKGAADNGMMLSGSHNIIERCIFDGNRDTGLQISRKSSSVTDYKDWPSYNSVINCTSRNNCDPATYENADGFAAKLTCGDGNIFDGCISYNNSDDGWDLFAKTETGSIGVITIRNCIAMRNGKTEDGTTNSNCDGNGFKLGGSGVPTPHVITNCLAIENLHHGFTDNNNPAALEVTNCTAFDNNKGGKKNNFSLYRCKDAVVTNCISYTTNSKTSDKLVNLSGNHIIYTNSDKWYKVTETQAIDTGSSASRGEVISSGTSASDFVNAKVPSVGTDFNELWRNDDGTINTNGVALISSSSQYNTFSNDGGSIGARFFSGNEVSEINVNLK